MLTLLSVSGRLCVLIFFQGAGGGGDVAGGGGLGLADILLSVALFH